MAGPFPACGTRFRFAFFVLGIALLASRSLGADPTTAPAAELQPFTTYSGHEDDIYVVRFSPDGTMLASGGKDQWLLLWDMKSGLYTPKYDHVDEVSRVTWSPDSKRMIIRGGFHTAIHVPLEGRAAPVSENDKFMFCGDSVFSRAGDRLFLSYTEGFPMGDNAKESVTSFKLPDFEPEQFDINSERFLQSMDVSPTGKMLAGAFERKAEKGRMMVLYFWDTTTGKPTGSLVCDTYDSWSARGLMRYRPDGKTMLYRKSDRSFAVWDFADRKMTLEVKMPSDVSEATCSRDARWLIVTQYKDAQIWDMSTGTHVFTLKGAADRIHTIDINSDGLVVAGAGKSLLFWTLPNFPGGQAVTLPAKQPPVTIVATAPDGLPFATAAAPETAPATAPATKPSDEEADKPLFDAPVIRPRTALRGIGDKLIGLAFTTDSQVLATSQDTDYARFWDLTTNQALPSPEGMFGERRLAITDDRKHLLGTGSNSLWMRTAKESQWRAIEHAEHASAIIHDSVAGQFLVGREDGTVATMKIAADAEKGDTVESELKGGPRAEALAMSPDGQFVAAAGYTTTRSKRDENFGPELSLVVWDRKSGKIVATAGGGRIPGENRYPVTLVLAFSADGHSLIYRQSDREFARWDWNGQEPRRLRSIHVLLPARNAAISPDGRLLATYCEVESERPVVNVWDTSTGELKWNMAGIAPNAKVECIAFSPDGKTLVAGSNKIAVVWTVPAIEVNENGK